MANLSILGFAGLGISFVAAVVAPLFTACGSSTDLGRGGAGGGTGAVDCSALRKNAETKPVAVRLVNNTAADVFFGDAPGSCDASSAPYDIEDAQGQPVPWQNKATCGFTCNEANCTAPCTTTATCPPHRATRVAPGATAELTWNGAVVEARTLPASCFGGSCSSEVECVSWVAPEAGTLTFKGTVWTGMKCQTDPCGCTPDASGTCLVVNGETTGSQLHAVGTFIPGSTSVYLTFQ